ncbi:MAG: PLxRFG domain-containing protein, partial [Zoogloeaceae bacterium]|nr:PLxRFG domain-containing protein [Zoogloeaceae bacterium]
NNESLSIAERARLIREEAANEKKQQKLIKEHFGNLLLYAPMSRVGSHFVVGKSAEYRAAERNNDVQRMIKLKADEAHYFVRAVDGEAKAKEVEREIRTRYDKSEVFEKDRFAAQHDPALYECADKIFRAIDVYKDAKSGAELKKIVNDMFLAAVADDSIRKTRIQRKGVSGMEADDMRRAFAAWNKSMGRLTATLTVGQKEREAFGMMQKLAKDPDLAGRDERMRYMNELQQRAADTALTTGEVAGKLLRASAHMHLMAKPFYYIQNALQTDLMLIPRLAQDFGYAESWRAGWDARKKSVDIALAKGEADIDSFTRFTDSEKKVLKELATSGHLDIGIMRELGDEVKRSDSKVGRFLHWYDAGLSGLMSRSEKINRAISGVTAYNLMRRRGKSHADAIKYAGKIIDETQGDYGGLNTPSWMKANDLMRLATQFRKFPLIQLTLFKNMGKAAFDQARTPEERRAAQKAFAILMAHHFVAAGLLGLPAAETIAWLGAIPQDKEDPALSEAQIHGWIAEAFGETFADVAMKGLPAAVGLDTSFSLGAGGMLSLVPFGKADLSSDKGRRDTLVDMAGPVVSKALSVFDGGVRAAIDGDFLAGVQQMVPAGYSHFIRAYRQMTEGVTKRSGEIAIPKEDIEWMTILGSGLGFQTTQTSKYYDAQREERERADAKTAANAAIKKQLYAADRENDMEAFRDARIAFEERNKKLRARGEKPVPMETFLKWWAEIKKKNREATR